MKNFLKIISVFCLLVFVSFTFMACELESTDRFYEQTNNVYSEFVAEICLNEEAEYHKGIKYGQNVTTILNDIKNGNYNDGNNNVDAYLDLQNVYDQLFTASFHFLSAFEGIFLVVPAKPTSEMKNDYQKFEKLVKKVQENIKNFHTNVEELDINIIADSAFGSISLQHLREYKRKLIDLCEDVVELDNSFLKLCQTYIYQKYDTYRKGDGSYIELTENQLKNQKTICNLQSVIETITPAIKYLNAFNGDYVKLETDKFFETLNEYVSLDNTNTNLTATVQELQDYLDMYNLYMNDVECFNRSLANIDMVVFMLDYNFNLENYAKEDEDRYAYVQKVYSFTENSVHALYTVNKKLCEA